MLGRAQLDSFIRSQIFRNTPKVMIEVVGLISWGSQIQFCEGLVQGAECKHPMRIQKGNPENPYRNLVGTVPRW